MRKCSKKQNRCGKKKKSLVLNVCFERMFLYVFMFACDVIDVIVAIFIQIASVKPGSMSFPPPLQVTSVRSSAC